MATKAAIACANISAVADQPKFTWEGGRTAVVVDATTAPTTMDLDLVGPNGSTIKINSSTLAANTCTIFDLPAGLYFIHMTGGTASAVYVTLVSIPYT
jgi:hypothetical protein